MSEPIKRMTINLDVDAAELLRELAPSPRRQGEFLSNLIRDAATRRHAAAGLDTESLRLHMLGLSKELQDVARLLSERQGGQHHATP